MKIEAAQRMGTQVVAKDAAEAGKLMTELKPILGKPTKQWETKWDQTVEWKNERMDVELTLTFGEDGKLGALSFGAAFYVDIPDNRQVGTLYIQARTAKDLVSILKTKVAKLIPDNEYQLKKFQGYVDELTAADDMLNKLKGIKA